MIRKNEIKHFTDDVIKALASATLLQAVKDFCYGGVNTKECVLKELKSPWMSFFTNGESDIVAEQLKAHPRAIKERLYKKEREEQLREKELLK